MKTIDMRRTTIWIASILMLLPALTSAGALTDDAEGVLLKAMFGNARDVSFAPATWYVALYTSNPGETAGGSECTGTDYARASVANSDANWDLTGGGATDANADGVADDATIENASSIDFATVGSGGWCGGSPATHWALLDASSGGTMWVYSALTSSVTLDAGDEPSFAAGALTFQLDD